MDDRKTMDYELIAKVLFESYETIYEIDLQTSAFRSFHESEDYKRLELEKSGDDFFNEMEKIVPDVIADEDVGYVLKMLQKDSIIAGLKREKDYTFVYRIRRRDGQEIYHQIRATYQPSSEGRMIFLGVSNVDAMMQRENAHREEMHAMRQKEDNHMRAVLATAAAYMEANVTKDILLEKSGDLFETRGRFHKSMREADAITSYSGMHTWMADHLVIKNRDRYRQIGSREYLLKRFAEGEKRTSVSFSILTGENETQPCREVFFLYEDERENDIHVFCMIYDLTEQQKKEEELESLEQELQLSRLRNFTSQMQPHFLYNTLGSIQEVILMDPEYAAELLGYFTVHLRSCLRAMTNDRPMPFSSELENVKAYINIEKMRFGDRLRINYDTEAMDFSILPLTIQPLVENAVRHGIYGRGPAGGEVSIRSREEDDAWIIQVEDDGVGFDVDRYLQNQKIGEGDSTGIKNIQFRLEKAMNAAIEIKSEEGKGTSVTVRVPKQSRK